MKVLVTGGAGFIGSNVTKYFLERNHQVVVLDNLSTGYKENLKPFPNVPLVVGNILDPNAVREAIKECDAVIHMAAAVGNVRSLENPCDDSNINVIGTLRVLEAAREAGIKKFVYSSSAAIFGEPKKLPIDEEHPFAPDSPYGVSKLGGELQVLCYGKLYDIDTLCLRYFNVYGPNQRFDAYGNVIPIFATRKMEKKPLTIYGDGDQTRDFINVIDVAQANYLAATQPNVSGCYNIGSGTSITIQQLANMVNELGTLPPVPVQYVSPRKGEVKHSLATIQKAEHKLGFQPQKDLKTGLQEYLEWISTT